MADYEFRYSPLTGRLTGKQMIEQTEQAINALASQVDSAAGQVEIISTLANEANENAATALETAEEALATTGRTYITVSTQTDANNYYDSQLIYIADSTSTNIPVADTGMLEVKTNDNKTACEQVFISDSSGDAYYRNGAITAETVGDVTTYTVTWGGWSSQPASQAYVQGELTNYLPLTGGRMTGLIQYVNNGKVFAIGRTGTGTVGLGWSYNNREGARLELGSTDYSTPGEFMLFARDANNSRSLIGKPNGNLTWDGKDVERVNAKGTDYIRYESGLQLCWGWVSINVNSTTGTTPFSYRGVVTITFPVAFRGTPFGVSNVDDGSPWWTTTVRSITSTTMQVEAAGNTSATKGVCWFAVGNWK